MTRFTVEHHDTLSGDAVEHDFSNAKAALEFAREAGSGVTITSPDGRHFHVSDFENAVARGDFD